MPITKLSFSNVGPFDEVDFEFDPQVNVFTGPNNSGKSSVLWVLGELLVFPFTMPARLIHSDKPGWKLGMSWERETDSVEGTLPTQANKFVHVYERIGYTCYVPAQRHGTSFRSPGPGATQDDAARADELVDTFWQDLPAAMRQHGRETLLHAWRSAMVQTEPQELQRRIKLMWAGSSLVSDKAVKQKIVDLDYESYRKGNPIIRATVNEVVSMASEITEGFPIQFLDVAEGSEGLYPQFRTPDGDLPLDVLSQGTKSIILFLAHLILGYAEYYDFPPNLEEKPGVLIIDEIDAHLHPSWQRRIIPALTSHFPNLQIFCSTHSPLMLAGLEAGQVHLLQRDESNRVNVTRNEVDVAGWSADEILRNFLGVPEPTDQKTVENLERLRELRRKRELSPTESDELESLRDTVSEDLLSGPVVAQIERFTQALKEARTDGEL